ncbi:phycocyanin alpha phycocyanobilin lyase [Methanosarcina sp. A14]|uniref:Phycocyanin alpha phycocyanobilin lyase n=1 Tax=Methanosarcina barkeri MS TaxID=1434108 RepID=A0A0E3QXK0_METBA|nr:MULTISPECIES: HEAT repeat domain-containing protein [Methanosarcina]AKB55518.1 Phycocyanin alpha phycocyanobilin lyase [Methanosarcina barkeri MS]OED06922.1 phycocyanin alpha phycocyanobilin lyase [Methanosarcina sp. A14]
MIKRYELFSFKSAKLLVLMFLLFGICAGCFEKDPVEARVNTLIQGLGDEDERVSSGSANELWAIGEPAVDPLIKALKDDNPQVRSLAAQDLGIIGDKKATNSLITALKDPVPEVRMNAAFSLGELQATEAVEPLIELLKDENGEVVRYTVIALGMLKDPRATEPLCEVLKRDDASISYDGNSNIRSEAVFALGDTGDPRAVDTLLDLLADKEVGSSAASSLGRIKGEYVFGKLIKLLGSKNPTTRTNAVAVYENIQDPAAVPILVRMLNDQVPEVRIGAAYALGHFNESEEIAQTEQPLIHSLEDSNVKVQAAAAGSLGRIESKKAIPLLAELIQSNNSSLCETAIYSLARYKNPEAADALIAALGNENWHIRMEIVYSLREVGDTRAVDPLIPLLGDENLGVRKSAATSLGSLGDRKAVEPIIKALETERESDVRISEVQALGILGGPEAINCLSRIGTDKDEYKYVRNSAEKGLMILKGGGTVNASSFY